jgi:uncharacterized protein YciI
MQFLVIAHDGTDDQAMPRRMAVRERHIAQGDELLASGNLWYGAALLDENRKMCGSMYLMDFENRTALDKWLETEPYVTGGVWQKIEVHDCNVRNPWQFSRSEAFFQQRLAAQTELT